MPLQKQAIDISFAKGLDTKTDPFRVSPGNFLSLENTIFDKGGQLKKRNGFELIANPAATSSTLPPKFVTTFNGSLTSLGSEVFTLVASNGMWSNKGSLFLTSLNVMALVRNNVGQTQVDSIVSSNGLVCTVYTSQVPIASVLTPTYYFEVSDAETGENIVNQKLISDHLFSAGTVEGSPRVFILGNYFIIIFTNLIGGTYHLQFIAISTSDPTGNYTLGELANSYVPAASLSWDAVVYSNLLYITYNNLTGGQNLRIRTLSNTLVVNAPVTYLGEIATMMSMCVDSTSPANPVIWACYYDSGSSIGKAFAIDADLNPLLGPTTIIPSGSYQNITSTAQNGILTFFAEVINNYSYNPAIPTHYIEKNTLTQAGVLGTSSVVIRSLGIASKSFLYNSVMYALGIYISPYQPSYFLFSENGKIISKFAYSNGPQAYYTTGLPQCLVSGQDIIHVAYLYASTIQASNDAVGSLSAPVYSQTGINLASIDLDVDQITVAEIGQNLNISGGFITSYDGFEPVEQGFFLWPDSVEGSATTGGFMGSGTYNYQVTYEWTDHQGNLFRSAASIPVTVIVSGPNNAVDLNIPTLRLTYKTSTPVQIVIYRWSNNQQTYYQITSITIPVPNDLTVDSIVYLDTLNDSSIIGNNILYTTGGVLENISPPASDNLVLFNNRFWLLDSENRNLLWYSKQVISSTPVEMSDLLTRYIAPSTAAEGSTGPITALAPMDDKLVIFKQNALGYINGTGPDNTGSNSGYSDFTLINTVIGCTNQNSIVLMPQGLMFETSKGIWLLGRDLSTSYIGAPVESFTAVASILSATNIPKTNQVRFTLDSGITLMYDYYYQQWGTFTDIPARSSTIYEQLHTYVNSIGKVYQESIGAYLDDTSPVLMQFTTGWMNFSGLQGFERFYYLLLLGTYLSPFKLNIQFSFNFNPSPVQSVIVDPSNSAISWGSTGSLWGATGTWGGTESGGLQAQANVFEARVFPFQQKCESFQISVQEIYDPSSGLPAAAGLTLSGMNLVVGLKRAFRTQRANRSFG